MLATPVLFACSQCGSPAPDRPEELGLWSYGRIAVRGDFADVIDVLLLCPGCVEEDHDHAFDEGAGD